MTRGKVGGKKNVHTGYNPLFLSLRKKNLLFDEHLNMADNTENKHGISIKFNLN